MFSQEPVANLNKWRENNPIEKLYLHTDREIYFPGQQIWVKGYLLTNFIPSINTSTMYVELLNNDVIIKREVFPVINGLSRGQIDIPDTLTTGVYTLRAYTLQMLNHQPDFLYRKQISITGSKTLVNVNGNNMDDLQFNFFPEGGNLVTGLNNTIAFKINNKQGEPLTAKGKIFNSNNKEVALFTTYHDGMGYFDLLAEAGQEYSAMIDDQQTKYKLPLQTQKGIVLRVFNVGNSKQFEIQQTGSDANFKAAYIVGQIQHHTVFTKKLSKDLNEHNGLLQTANLPSGIMQITVFNDNHQPIAERLTFVNNKEYKTDATLQTETINIRSREKNNWAIKFPDAFKGNVSVSITDADFDTTANRNHNILTGFLLSSDVRGYIHKPSYYFINEGEAVDNALDLVMMTNGWRRFRWEELSASLTKKQFIDPGFIKVKGTVNLANSKKAFADKDLLLKLTTADKSDNMQMLKTNKKGEFEIDSMFFFGQSKFLFTDVRGVRNNDIKVTLAGDSLLRFFNLPGEKLITPTKWNNSQWINDFLKNHQQELGKTLGEVTVKAKRKATIEEIEERYVSGLFAGDAVRRINLLDETMYGYNNIFDYIQFRVPGVASIWNDNENEHMLYYRHNQNQSVSSMGSQPMTIFLDEIETDPNVLGRIHPSQIAYAKLFSTFVGAAGAGGNGVLALYTKKGEDALADMRMLGDEMMYTGYTVIKDFYSPDYAKVKKEDNKPDNRITLYWNAGIPVDSKENKVPVVFFNNDKTKRFKIVVEGVSQDGKLVFMEKIVELDKKPF